MLFAAFGKEVFHRGRTFAGWCTPVVSSVRRSDRAVRRVRAYFNPLDALVSDYMTWMVVGLARRTAALDSLLGPASP